MPRQERKLICPYCWEKENKDDFGSSDVLGYSLLSDFPLHLAVLKKGQTFILLRHIGQILTLVRSGGKLLFPKVKATTLPCILELTDFPTNSSLQGQCIFAQSYLILCRVHSGAFIQVWIKSSILLECSLPLSCW